jgi:hypothetical protein
VVYFAGGHVLGGVGHLNRVRFRKSWGCST